MHFESCQPDTVTKIRFLVVTEKILVEQIASNSVNQRPAKQQTGAFDGKNRIAAIIFLRIFFPVTIVIKKAEACQEGTANIQGISMPAQNHLALHNTNLRVVTKIFDQGLKKVRRDDGVVIEQQNKLSAAGRQAKIVSPREPAIMAAVNDTDGGIPGQHFC